MKDKIPFKVSARTARLIGRENVSKAESALIELIKNSYDADATSCLVYIDAKSSLISIYDNGEGMTLKTIKNKWMVIGTDNKRDDFLTENERIKVGAKGIGRFALDRLGGHCKMITKSGNNEIYQWEVDWGDFEEKGKNISDVKANVENISEYKFPQNIEVEVIAHLDWLRKDEERSTEYHDTKNAIDNLLGSKTHTHLNITKLRDSDNWKNFDYDSLYENLRSLIPPFEEDKFNIVFLISGESELYGLVPSVITDEYDYRVKVKVHSIENVEVTIDRNEFEIDGLQGTGFFKQPISLNSKFTLENFEEPLEYNTSFSEFIPGLAENKALKKQIKKIGPFNFEFFFLKRGFGGGEKGTNKYPYKKFIARDRINWLNEFGGIKIYRDKFRVRPYGEIGSSSFDWLGLGARAAGSPTVTKKGYKVRPNQVIGLVNISRVGNKDLDDRSSREGLQENDVFATFKNVVLSFISFFEKDRNRIMIVLKQIYDDNNERAKKKKEADEILEDNSNNTGDDKSEEKQKLLDAIRIYKEEAEELKHDQRIMRALASTGLIITSFTHEFSHLKRKMSSRTRNLENSIKPFITDEMLNSTPEEDNPYILISDIKGQDKSLKSWLEFAISAVKKDKRKRKNIDLVKYVDTFERTWNSLLVERNVSLILNKENFKSVFFKGFEIDMDSMMNNLISNSIDVFRSKRHTGKRIITISFSLSQNISILYEDSGPGLSSDIVDPTEIFEPFFTTKVSGTGEVTGTGLGLYIVKSIVDDYKGKINFHKLRPGFKIEINLPFQN